MTRARIPRPQEVAAARRDPRLMRAVTERHDNAWRTRGVCQTVDPETFFPVPMAPADVAVELCTRCPVSGACLAWALSVGDCHGVWGGTTARERRAMLVAWRTEEHPEEWPYVPAESAETFVSAGELVSRQLPPPGEQPPIPLGSLEKQPVSSLEKLPGEKPRLPLPSMGEKPRIPRQLIPARERARAAC